MRRPRNFDRASTNVGVAPRRLREPSGCGARGTRGRLTSSRSSSLNLRFIEGSFGLGESVVSGSVSPDRYIVEKDTLSILGREVRAKELILEPLPDGGTRRRALHGEEARRSVLSDQQVVEIATLGRRIETQYGSSQNTE